MLESWILKRNLKPFIETVSGFVGYGFDTWDWDAIRCGVKGTDIEADRWYAYELLGERLIKLLLASDPGSSVVFVRVDADKDLEDYAEVAVNIIGTYELSNGP